MYSKLLTIAALAFASAQAEDQSIFEDIEEIMAQKHAILDEKILQFDIVRGLWIGLNRGLYQHSSGREMEKHCMNEEGRENFVEFYEVFLGLDDIPSSVDSLSALGDLIKVFANLTTCEWRKPLIDLHAFCNKLDMVERDPMTPTEISDDDLALGDVKRCAFPTIMENYTKNAFVLMGKGSQLAEAWKEFPSQDPEMALQQALTLGEGVGTFARVGLDFVSA